MIYKKYNDTPIIVVLYYQSKIKMTALYVYGT